MSQANAASRLAPPAERGSLRLAYRRSVVAMQQALGWNTPSSSSLPEGERESDPLLYNDANGGEGSSTGGVAGYGSVMDLPPERRVPKPKHVRGPVRVEAKVWFANERTWISWLRVSLLIGSFSLAMYNSAAFFTTHPRQPHTPEHGAPWTSPDAQTIRRFAVVYALIAVLTLSWGLFNYHRRLYLIKTKYAGDFDDMYGPPVICAALFVAVLLNFIVRVKQHNAEVGN